MANSEEPKTMEFLGEHGLVDMLAAEDFVADDPSGTGGNDHEYATTDQNAAQYASMAMIQSLLGQFASPQVRADFLDHQFNWLNVPKLLNQLDELRLNLLPRWQSETFSETSQLSARAAESLHVLVNRSAQELVFSDDPAQRVRSYRGWIKLLNIIATDLYWKEVPHFTTSTKQEIMFELMSDSSNSRDSSFTRSKTKHYFNSRYRKISDKTKKESTIISCSDSNDSSSECEGSTSSSEHRRNQSRRKRVKRSNKEVETIKGIVTKLLIRLVIVRNAKWTN